jgi:uncharacterized membrane protein
MKKRSNLFAISLLAVLAVFFSLSEAEAVKVTLDNYRNQKVAAALVYYDVNQGSWCCQGWWIVDPMGKRTINVPHNPKNRIYYYVQSGGKVVHKRAEGWVRRDVISNAFKYYEHDGCPNGKNYKTVYFNCSTKATGKSWTLNIN